MMKIFIDHNIWDELFRRDLDLPSYFSKEKYSLCMTLHGEYEVRQIPKCKSEFRGFINKYAGFVDVYSGFGFYDPRLPADEQRVTGFGEGAFSTINEEALRRNLNEKYGTIEKRKQSQILFKQEADIELGVIALNFPVLTFDSKPGPLRDSFSQGGKVVFLNPKTIKYLSNQEFVSHIKERCRQWN